MVPENLEPTARYLIEGAKAPRTLAQYESVWNNYTCFLLDFDLVHSEIALSRYICCLYDNNYKGSTITSHVSALNYACSLNGQLDYSKSTLIKEMLKGARNRTCSLDQRKPISEAMLISLMRAVHWVVAPAEKQILIKTIFSWAYYAALRVSEYTEVDMVDHNIKFSDIWRQYEVDDVVYKLKFTSYKCHPQGSPADYT